MTQFDVLAIGDSILDIFLTITNENDFCSYDKTTGQLMLHAGEKILVDQASFMLGGNACNISVGTKRLGLSSGLIAEFGDDEFAAKLKKGLLNEGVSLDFAKTTPGTQSTFSVGIHVATERTLFIHHVERKHDIALIGFQTKWIYLTSLGEEWETLYERTSACIKQTGTKLAFNPGSQQLKDGVGTFKGILPLVDILFVNKDEAQEILYGKVEEKSNTESPQDIMFKLQRMGSRVICMTDGENGSYALDETGKFYTQGTVEPKSYTGKTGAGDAFASGFLSAIILGNDIKTALLWGSVNASGVLEHIGAQTGLLTKQQIEERIRLI